MFVRRIHRFVLDTTGGFLRERRTTSEVGDTEEVVVGVTGRKGLS